MVRSTPPRFHSCLLLLCACALLACSRGETPPPADVAQQEGVADLMPADSAPDRGHDAGDLGEADGPPLDAPVGDLPPCGNGVLQAGEDCDDGNQFDPDGCNNLCQLPGGHLLLTEIGTGPTGGEFIEIFNPGATVVALDAIHLADRNDYYKLPEGLSGATYDFIVRFPAGATLAAGAYATVAFDGIGFKAAFGAAPDYEIEDADGTVPDMEPACTSCVAGNASLSDAGELVVLFSWDGSSDLVGDLDYVVWEQEHADAVFKTGQCVDGPDGDSDESCYADDTDVASQSDLVAPQPGGSLHRCVFLETGESTSGGNGPTGHDETSEPFADNWKRNPNTPTERTPGGPAPPGFCSQ